MPELDRLLKRIDPETILKNKTELNQYLTVHTAKLKIWSYREIRR